MPDAYERQYMRGDGEMLYRHKARLAPWVFGIAAGLPGALVGGAGAALLATGVMPLAPALAISAAGLGLAVGIGVILLSSGVVRTAVSEGEVDVQFAMQHLRIPVHEIESVTLAPSPTRNVGIGVRRTLGGEIVYSMLGSPKRAVHIRRRGHDRTTVLVCREPDALADAIEAARTGKTPALRVAAEDEGESEHEVVETVGADAPRDTEAET